MSCALRPAREPQSPRIDPRPMYVPPRPKRPHLGLHGFHLPALIVYGMFVLFPFAHTVLLSFHDWDGFGEPAFVGTGNYVPAEAGRDAVLTDAELRRGLANNARYWIITLFTEVVAGFAMAALLARTTRGRTFYRLALSLPLMIALVASGVLWRNILGYQGLLNGALGAVGLDGLARNWLSAEWVVISIGIVSGWVYAGFFMLIFGAGFERIPAELREAARIDGAGEWSILWRVELPLLRPVIAVCVLLCSTGAFRAFDLFYVFAGGAASNPAEVAATYLVKTAFTSRFFGYASAIAVVVVGVVVGLAALLNLWVSRERELEY